MQIFAGNIPTTYTDDELRKLFEPHGTVRSAVVSRDKKTGKSQGYGFIEMPVKSEARAAIEALRGKDLTGMPMLVRALKPGDDFLQHAVSLHGGAHISGKNSGKQFTGNAGPRGTGAIRRGGQRGS